MGCDVQANEIACEHGIRGCVMPGLHLEEECHTAEMIEDQNEEASTLTEEKIKEVRDRLASICPPPPRDPFGLFGYKLITTPPEPPKLQLSKGVAVSADFRREYNAWLIERFGFQDPLLKRNEVLVSSLWNTMIMRPETAALIHCSAV